MIDERCKLTELLTSECAHCRPKVAPERVRIIGRLIFANYYSDCGECGEPIKPGDQIGRGAVDRYWICADCAEPETELRDLIP